MGQGEEWVAAVSSAAAQAGEELWRLPLDADYDELIKGRYADISNVVESRKAGSITAAQFLARFVGDVPWVHLDIAGVAWDRGRAYARKGGTGFGVRTLVELARSVAA
jgi:leucyl aminopeptidase